MRIHETAGQLGLGQLEEIDTDWASKQEEENKRELARLEGELRGYKNNLIRESIRMGQEDLAMHLLLTGGPTPDPANPQSQASAGYNAAYQAFGKMRDYCTTPTHVASMTLRLIYTTLLQAVSAQQTGGSHVTHLHSALANANRIRTVGVKDEEMAKLVPIMHVTLGIGSLGMGQYREAAIGFLAAPFDYVTLGAVYGSDFNRIVASGNDVAIYGGLCALATMTRDELIDHVLNGPFRAFLEMEPHMRKAITLYTTAKYESCLSTLQSYYSDWSLDVFLGACVTSTRGSSHLDHLLHRIREKSITAYFSSFSQVSLSSLAMTFPPSLSSSAAAADLETELLAMIESGRLNARLDVVNGTLTAPAKGARTSTHVEAKDAAEEVERTLLLRLHKVNVALAGLEVPRAKGAMDVGRMGNGWQ